MNSMCEGLGHQEIAWRSRVTLPEGTFLNIVMRGTKHLATPEAGALPSLCGRERTSIVWEGTQLKCSGDPAPKSGLGRCTHLFCPVHTRKWPEGAS